MPLIRVRDNDADAKLAKQKCLIKYGVAAAVIASAILYQWSPGLAVYVGLVPVATLSVRNYLHDG